MKRSLIFAAVIIAVVVAGAIAILSPSISRGEHDVEGGSVYVFSDGLVGCDTTSKPKRFFIAMIDPKNVVGFDFDDEGFDVEIRPSSVGAGSTANKVSLNMRTDTAIPVMQQSSGEYSVTGMRLDVVPLEELIANGDWDGSLSKILELKTITKPKFDGVVLHRFPDGKLTGVGSLPASANGFEGLEDVTITRNYSETKSVELQFSFEFLNHRDGKDIYFFEWHAYQIRQSAKDEVGSRGGGASGQMAYDGTPMTLYGGKHGTTKLMSRELAIGEDGEYVDGSDQVVSQETP